MSSPGLPPSPSISRFCNRLPVRLCPPGPDTEKALRLMEECQSEAGDEGFRARAEKLLNIFQSDLFQALLGEAAGWVRLQAMFH
ncbi:DLG4 protein, partial [Atractosteus spatula]|nr:DLG4 protein [Atractosteus spatula]